MKELDIPYIGVKIESLPTILEVLKKSATNEDFIEYYTNLGKSPKTASEYLASLRNLRLAKKDKAGNTILVSAGISLSENNVNELYSNLLQHCLKNFPDLKLIKDLLQEGKINSLSKLIEVLNNRGFTIKRKQTLSSYYKMFFESGNSYTKDKSTIAHQFSKEPLEYNQFFKLLKKFAKTYGEEKIVIKELFKWMQEKYNVALSEFVEFLQTVKVDDKVKLYEINPRVLKDPNDAFEINNKLYYFIELI